MRAGIVVALVLIVAVVAGVTMRRDSSSGPDPVETVEGGLEGLRSRVDAAPEDRDLRLRFARLLHEAGQAEQALPEYEEVIRLDPDDPWPYYDLASALTSLGRLEAAAATLHRRIARAPEDAMALYNMGALQAHAGDSASAIDWWQRAREVASDDELKARVDQAIASLREGSR